jgi:hypothetical protein
MFEPRTAPDREFAASSLKPSEVLYYFDEPLVFRADGKYSPLLCNKTDDDGEGINQYICVQTSDRVVANLKSGRMSLRAAFEQPWCWIIEARSRYEVIRSWGLATDSVPEHFLPDPGYGLLPEHQFLDAQSFISMKFVGGQLENPDLIDFGVFKNLVDQAYSSLKRIFFSAFDDWLKHGVTENSLNRMIQMPIRQPVLASLRLDIGAPQISPNMMRNPPDIDYDEAQKRVGSAAENFLLSAEKLTQAAAHSLVSEELAQSNILALQAISQIVPTFGSDFELLEISGRRVKGGVQTIKINTQMGELIKEAHRKLTVVSDAYTGTIVELSLRSGTFILKKLNSREVTCTFPSKKIREEAFRAFQEGMKITASGVYSRRTRRDFLVVDRIELPDGSIIRRDDENT